jgi:hypothetical protein
LSPCPRAQSVICANELVIHAAAAQCVPYTEIEIATIESGRN